MYKLACMYVSFPEMTRGYMDLFDPWYIDTASKTGFPRGCLVSPIACEKIYM